MSAIPFDPFRTETRLLWHNRVAHWNAHRGESAVHALALLALAAVLAWPASDAVLHGTWPDALRATIANWPLSTLAIVTVALVLRQHAVRQARARDDARHWLATQPLAASLPQRRLRRATLLEAMLQGFALAIVLLVVAAPALWWLLAATLVAAVAGIAPWTVRRQADTTVATSHWLRSAHRIAGPGRLWRWQAIDIGIAWRGRSLAGGILMLLTVPMGSGPLVITACLVAGLLLAWFATAWNRSLAVLPQAQAWLAAQPLSPRRLLLATAAVPATLLCLALLLLALLFVALDASRFGAIACAAVAAFALLQAACTMAERRRPRRIALTLAVHATLLIGLLQAVPYLAPLAWMLQLSWLLRRALA